MLINVHHLLSCFGGFADYRDVPTRRARDARAMLKNSRKAETSKNLSLPVLRPPCLNTIQVSFTTLK